MTDQQVFDFTAGENGFARAGDLQSEGFEVNFKTNDQHLPSNAVEAVAGNAAGVFSNWQNGYADYDILDIRTKQVTKNWGMRVDDPRFEAAFSEFVEVLRHMR